MLNFFGLKRHSSDPSSHQSLQALNSSAERDAQVQNTTVFDRIKECFSYLKSAIVKYTLSEKGERLATVVGRNLAKLQPDLVRVSEAGMNGSLSEEAFAKLNEELEAKRQALYQKLPLDELSVATIAQIIRIAKEAYRKEVGLDDNETNPDPYTLVIEMDALSKYLMDQLTKSTLTGIRQRLNRQNPHRIQSSQPFLRALSEEERDVWFQEIPERSVSVEDQNASISDRIKELFSYLNSAVVKYRSFEQRQDRQIAALGADLAKLGADLVRVSDAEIRMKKEPNHQNRMEFEKLNKALEAKRKAVYKKIPLERLSFPTIAQTIDAVRESYRRAFPNPPIIDRMDPHYNDILEKKSFVEIEMEALQKYLMEQWNRQIAGVGRGLAKLASDLVRVSDAEIQMKKELNNQNEMKFEKLNKALEAKRQAVYKKIPLERLSFPMIPQTIDAVRDSYRRVIPNPPIIDRMDPNYDDIIERKSLVDIEMEALEKYLMDQFTKKQAAVELASDSGVLAMRYDEQTEFEGILLRFSEETKQVARQEIEGDETRRRDRIENDFLIEYPFLEFARGRFDIQSRQDLFEQEWRDRLAIRAQEFTDRVESRVRFRQETNEMRARNILEDMAGSELDRMLSHKAPLIDSTEEEVSS